MEENKHGDNIYKLGKTTGAPILYKNAVLPK